MQNLFSRDGTKFNGTPEFNDAGKPVRYVPVACDRCCVINGQRLWVRWIENNQPRSNTGFDCWTCGNTGVRGQRKERLYTAVELARVNKSAATRAVRKAEAHRIAVEQAEAALVAKEAAFRTGNADFIAKLDTLDGDYWDGFKQSFYARREAPTDRQIALVEGEVAKRQKNAVSEFVGIVGQKVDLILTVERIVVLHSEFYGTNYITIARTPEGNVVTYKGLVDLGAVGETKTVKATVKDHTLYQNTRQTVIQRPKLLQPA
jgi:hypothetical protein